MKAFQPVHFKSLLGWKTRDIDLQFAAIKTDPESNRLRNTQMLDWERRDVNPNSSTRGSCNLCQLHLMATSHQYLPQHDNEDSSS